VQLLPLALGALVACGDNRIAIDAASEAAPRVPDLVLVGDEMDRSVDQAVLVWTELLPVENRNVIRRPIVDGGRQNTAG